MEKRISLKNKIITAFIFMLLFFGLIVIFVINQILPQALKNEMKQRGITIARNVANRSAIHMLANDFTAIKYIVNEEKELSKDIVYVFVVNWTKEVVAHTFAEKFPAELRDANSVSSSQVDNICLLDTEKGFIYDMAVPIVVSNERFGMARIGMSDKNMQKTVNNALGIIIGIIAGSIILSILIGFGMASLITKPIKELHQATEEMMEGNLNIKINVPAVLCWEIRKCGKKSCPAYEKTDIPCWYVVDTICEGETQGDYAQKIKDCKICGVYKSCVGFDEIQQLSFTFNEMATRLKSYYENLEEKIKEKTAELQETHIKLIQAEKLAAISQIAAEAAHEVKNPLQVMKAGLYYLKRTAGKEDANVQKIVQKLDNAIERAIGFINDLLNFSRPPQLKTAKCQVNELIDGAIKELPAALLADIEVTQNLSGDIPEISADTDRIRQVLVNLIKNAADAMGEVKSKKLEVKSLKEGDFIKITISDTGNGIPKESIDKIFTPFYTTKSKGFGLGLAICQRLIEAHQGRIAVESEVGVGTTFTVQLPIYNLS